VKENEAFVVAIYPFFDKQGRKKLGIAPQDRDALRRLFGQHIQLKRTTRTVVDDEGTVGETEVPVPLDQGWMIFLEGVGYKCILADDCEWYMEDNTVENLFPEGDKSDELVDERRKKQSMRERIWGKKVVRYCKILIASVYSNYEYYFNLKLVSQLRDAVTSLEAAQYPFRAMLDSLGNKRAEMFLRQKWRISPTDDMSQEVGKEIEEIGHIAMSDSGHEAQKYIVRPKPADTATRAPEAAGAQSESLYKEV
jgi:hypothetical protein